MIRIGREIQCLPYEGFLLESIVKKKKGIEIHKSDHHTICSKFTFKWNTDLKKHRYVHFNLKNKEGQEKFKEATSKSILILN